MQSLASPPTASPNPPSFHSTLLTPRLAKSLIQDPLVFELNIEIYMLLPSEHTVGSALAHYTTKLTHCEDPTAASAYARAGLQVLALYSLTRMRYEWLNAWHADSAVRNAAAGVVLMGGSNGNLGLGSDEQPAATETTGEAWKEQRKVLVEFLGRMEGELGLRGVRVKGWDPRAHGAQQQKKVFVDRLDGGMDKVVGEALALVLCPTVHP